MTKIEDIRQRFNALLELGVGSQEAAEAVATEVCQPVEAVL